MNDYTHIDLFSGIGGFALAARANGIRTIQFCECDERCRAFLAKAWPRVPICDDVRKFMADAAKGQDNTRALGNMAEAQGCRESSDSAIRGIDPVFLLTAGVPCQPASRAGKQRGSADDRWLWPEAIRVLGSIRPTWAIFENPPGIGDVGLAGILSDVEGKGYKVRVFSIPACAIGAPHRRERYWIVARKLADRYQERHEGQPWPDESHTERRKEPIPSESAYHQGDMADAAQGGRCSPDWIEQPESVGHSGRDPWSQYVWLPCADGKVRRAPDDTQRMAYGLPVELLEELGAEGRQTPEDCEVHRSLLGALGNAIIPQVATEIIKAIVESDSCCK